VAKFLKKILQQLIHMNLSNYFFRTDSIVLISVSHAVCWHFILCMKLGKPQMSDLCQKFPLTNVWL